MCQNSKSKKLPRAQELKRRCRSRCWEHLRADADAGTQLHDVKKQLQEQGSSLRAADEKLLALQQELEVLPNTGVIVGAGQIQGEG
jgi:hypothetical protein